MSYDHDEPKTLRIATLGSIWGEAICRNPYAGDKIIIGEHTLTYHGCDNCGHLYITSTKPNYPYHSHCSCCGYARPLVGTGTTRCHTCYKCVPISTTCSVYLCSRDTVGYVCEACMINYGRCNHCRSVYPKSILTHDNACEKCVTKNKRN